MTEKRFTEEEIREGILEVGKSYSYFDDMTFHDKILIENLLMKIESAIIDGVRLND